MIMDDNDIVTVSSRQKKEKVGLGLAAIEEKDGVLDLRLCCPTEILIFKRRSSFLLHEGMFR